MPPPSRPERDSTVNNNLRLFEILVAVDDSQWAGIIDAQIRRLELAMEISESRFEEN